MEYRVRINMLSGAIVLAVGVAVSAVTSTVVASRAYQSKSRIQARSTQEIAVKGSARTRVRSDLAVWRIGLTGEGKTLQDAYAMLEAGVSSVQQFLGGAGFMEGEVLLGSIDTSEFRARDDKGQESREIAGYVLTRCFTVTTPAVERVDAAASEVTRLIKEGVRVSSARPEFYYSKAADLKIQVMGDATKDARTRADEIAQNAGCSVGEVRRAQMGVVQITQPNSTEVSGYGIYDTNTIEKDVSVVVTISFGVDGE